MTCCFFGHRDTPQTVEEKLEALLERLIVEEGADRFLVGNEGNFDRMVYRVLQRLRLRHPDIICLVVLAYMQSRTVGSEEDTLFPEGLESVPPRFAIDHRNRWLLARSDAVVVYVRGVVGGAAKYATIAARQGLRVINLAME